MIMTGESIVTASKLYREGATIAEIAKALGYSRTTTERRLISAGVIFRASKRRPYHEKHCKICNALKTRESFAKGHGAICADCWRVHPPKMKSKRNRAIRQYGLTIENLNSILELQQFQCAVCFTSINYRSQIDHCHSTGKVRGVLCGFCNKMLGMAKDDPKVLRSAALYLERS